MENNIHVRLGELVKTLKMSTNAFAKSIGKSQSGISIAIEGKTKPSFDVLDSICEVHNVNPSWLLTGEGEMFKSGQLVSTDSNNYLKDYLAKLEDQFNGLLNQLSVKDKQMDGMQRTIDALLGKHKDVISIRASRGVMKMYPEEVGATA